MAEKQRNERTSTRYDGVYQRESRVKRHKGKPDVCYMIDYRDPLTGKRVRQTIGWKSKEITAEYANVVRSNLLAKGQKEKFAGVAPQEAKDIPTLAQAWDLYRQDWLEAQGSKGIVTDTGFFTHHLKALAYKRLNQITAHDLHTLAAGLQRRGLSAQTAKHVLAFVRRIMRKMIAWKQWTGPTPFDEIKMPKVNNNRQRYLTPYEAKALLDSLKAITPRMWLVSLLSLHCGLRFGEVVALRRSDIDFDARLLFVRDPKNGKDRFAVMTDAICDALRAMPARSPSSLLFPTQNNTILKEKDGIFEDVVAAWEFNEGITDNRQKVVFHTLRHTYASWLAKKGNGQSTIADLLGHSSLEMSRRYTHLMPDVKRDTAAAISSMFTSVEHQEPR